MYNFTSRRKGVLQRTSDGFGSDAAVLNLQQIGDAIGVTLPEDLVLRLKLKSGDKLRLVELVDGSLQRSLVDQDNTRAMQIADDVMNGYQDALAALAK